EERKKKLAAEGLFDPAHKRKLPFLPDVIGVVTSPTGAVIRDIMHRLEARFPRRVLLWPVAVQGERAAFESTIPLISAVGHETDTTLIDFVSDIRAPTPTAAAELAVPVRSELLGQTLDFTRRLLRCFSKGMDDRRRHLAQLARVLPRSEALFAQP